MILIFRYAGYPHYRFCRFSLLFVMEMGFRLAWSHGLIKQILWSMYINLRFYLHFKRIRVPFHFQKMVVATISSEWHVIRLATISISMKTMGMTAVLPLSLSRRKCWPATTNQISTKNYWAFLLIAPIIPRLPIQSANINTPLLDGIAPGSQESGRSPLLLAEKHTPCAMKDLLFWQSPSQYIYCKGDSRSDQS